MINDSDRLPLTRSLEAEARGAFAVPARSEGLNRQALLSALEGLRPGGRSLAESLHDAGFMPPSADDQPVLDWVDAIFAHWQTHYPVAPELQQALDRARQLAAAFAVKDSRFFVPGGHAVHRLLDVIHNGLIGWHTGLGSAAGNALEGAKEALERARRDFPSEPQVDETLELLSQKIQAHDAQLKRLDGVLLEREISTMGEDLTRMTVAFALNSILSEHEVPGSVARFVKSDWYESGVIIAAQHGEASQEWRKFINTTQILVQAVQPIDTGDSDGQARLQATMHQLPSTLSRQLLSLQPDHDAIAGAIGLIEYALLRNMRGEDLGLLLAEPLTVPGMPEGGPPSEDDLLNHGIHPGGWYSLDTADGELRIRLAGGLAGNIYLLFMDFLGARAIRKTYAEFRSMLVSGEAKALNVPDSFCRSMVEATEIRERETAAEKAEQAAHERARAEAEESAQAQLAATLSGHNPLGHRASGYQASGHNERDQHEDQGAPDQSASGEQRHQQADQNHTEHHGDYQRQEGQPQGQASSDPSHTSQASHSSHSSLATTHRDDSDSLPSTDSPYESNTVVKLQIPMGTWMGFHDREPPLLARVAVRDLEKDSYIFTNREGIKLRELTVAQLIALIDRDMVDILERKTNFRDTINQMRQDQDRIATT